MKMHSKLLAVAASVAVVAFGVVAQSAVADGTPDTAYACAPGDFLTPATYIATDTNAFPSWDSFHAGWWSPYAETSVPTGAVVGDYYLTCTQFTGWTQDGTYLLGSGQELTPQNGPNPYLNSANLPIPGAYAVIQPAAAPPTTP